jgi:hypothetical protein
MVTKAYTLLGLFLAGGLVVLGSFGSASGETNRGVSADERAVATFAGGCFWCMEHPFDELEGVVSTPLVIPAVTKKIRHTRKFQRVGPGMPRQFRSSMIRKKLATKNC